MEKKISVKNYNKLKNLIAEHCSNYADGNCLPLNCVCPQILNCETRKVICHYCRDVLLYDTAFKEIKAELTDTQKNEDKKKCAICGSLFIGKGRAKYCCDECRQKAQREQQAKYQKKYRQQS